MEHYLNTSVADEYGVNAALFMQHLKFWTFNNLANKRNIHDGYCWTYNTLDALRKTFSYWSIKQLRTVIDHCVNSGLVIKGNYNQTPYDRTCWYALTHKSYHLYPELAKKENIDELYRSINIHDPICPFGQIDSVEWTNRFGQKGQPIPDTKPDTKPKIKRSMSDKRTDIRFEEFWDKYPVKTAKKACAEKWRAKKLDSIADKILAKLDEQISSDESWKSGFSPNPLTYINQERWEDEVRLVKPKIVATQQTIYDDEDTSWIQNLSNDVL